MIKIKTLKAKQHKSNLEAAKKNSALDVIQTQRLQRSRLKTVHVFVLKNVKWVTRILQASLTSTMFATMGYAYL